MMADQDFFHSPLNNRQSKLRLRTLSPFRYPGGKSWLREKVLKWIAALDYRPSIFIEPFAGGGSIGLVVAELGLADRVVLIERDPDVAAVWKVMLGDRWRELTANILTFRMSRKRVLEVLDSNDEDVVARAFRCVLRNRVQRGGILSSTAGLLREGERGRGLKSRWYPKTLAARIKAIYEMRSRIQFVEGDALEVLPSFKKCHHCAFFVDPPYTANGKGPGFRLYRFAEIDHEKLFGLLAQLSGACFVTYHPTAPVKRIGEQFGFTSSTTGMRTTHHRHRRELVFLRPRIFNMTSALSFPRQDGQGAEKLRERIRTDTGQTGTSPGNSRRRLATTSAAVFVPCKVMPPAVLPGHEDHQQRAGHDSAADQE